MTYCRVCHSRSSAIENHGLIESALKPLLQIAGNKDVRKLAPADLERYIAALEKNPRIRSMATKRTYTLTMLAFLTYLKKRNIHTRDVGQDWLKKREAQDRPLSWETPKGRREINRGKAQLRNQAEVSAYLSAALSQVPPYNLRTTIDRAMVTAERRVASCLPLLCGLASGEILHLRVGDIDLDAGLGRVRDDSEPADGWHVKTANRAGAFTIPDVLRPFLETLTTGRGADEYLFHQDQLGDDDAVDCRFRTHGRHWLNDLVHDVCAAARVGEGADAQPVRQVSPHGLRGTYASLLRELMGTKIGDIANALRHGDHGETATRHYVGAQATMPAFSVVIKGESDANFVGQSLGSVQTGALPN